MHTYIYLHTPYHLVSGKRRGQSGEAWREKGGAMYTSSMYTSVGTIDTSVGVYKRGGIGPIRAQIHVIYEYFCHFVYDQTRAIYVLTRSLVYSLSYRVVYGLYEPRIGHYDRRTGYFSSWISSFIHYKKQVAGSY
jgi:hypothetical protein